MLIKRSPEIIFSFFWKLFPISIFFIVPLQGTKTAVTHVTEVRCAVNAIWNNWAGKNKTRSYNNKQGNKHYLTEIVGDEVILLDKKTE